MKKLSLHKKYTAAELGKEFISRPFTNNYETKIVDSFIESAQLQQMVRTSHQAKSKDSMES